MTPADPTKRSGQDPVLRSPERNDPLWLTIKAVKRFLRHTAMDLGKRSTRFKRVYRAALRRKRDRNYRSHVSGADTVATMVVFESYQGHSYSCSPKAIYRAMRRDPRFDGFTFVWAFKTPADYLDHPDMAGTELVRYESQEYYRAHAEAKYWVSNSRLPDQVEPRPGQVYVQAWHGTPLKRIGCDLEMSVNALYSSDELASLYVREAERMTMLLSPSRFASKAFTTSFGLRSMGREGVIFESGYPRNDFLHTFTADDVTRIRADLDLPEGKRVVLYAPTWRENQHVTGVGYTYDVEADLDHLHEDLGDGYVILFRAHYFVSNDFDFEHYGGFVRDVSGVDDINDLYVVSDVLVTDYSSVFFDYANLGRPVVFYMYDLETYAEEMRGFYLELDELPGPIVRTEAELVEALRGLDASDPVLVERYAAFRKRFTYLDDGHASERVIERMLAEGARRG